MAPGRRKPAKGFKLKNDLLVGDLVLAKVKGYPPWPAKISRPEDWEKVPDPKKFFVHFFGTDEIGYVAPSDIHPLTSEAKGKLLAKSIGKKVKFYAKAVEQICQAFDELQQRKRKDQADRSYRGAESPSGEEVEPDTGVDEKKDTFQGNGLGQETNSRLDPCSLKHDAVGFGQAIPEDLSFVPVIMHSDTKKDLSRNNAESTEELVESPVNHLDNSGEHLNDGKTLVDFIHPKISNVAELAEGLSLGKSGGPFNIEDNSSGKNILAQKGDCSSLLVSSCATYSNGEKIELTNSHQSHKVAMGLKRKSDNDPEAHISSSAMAPFKNKNPNSEAGCSQLVDDVRETGQTKISQLGKESSNDIKSDLNVTGGQKSKRLPEKNHGEASGKVKKVVESRHKDEYGVKDKVECEASELKNRPRLGCIKKNMESEKVAPPLEMVRKGVLEGDANESSPIINKKNIFRSTAVYRKKVRDKTLSCSMRSDNHAGTRSRINNSSSDIAREKDALLQTKHHGQAMEDMTDSTFSNVDSIIETHGVKSIMSQVNRDRTPVSLLPTKRRVVRLLDDDDDEGSPKTPVHGVASLKASSLSFSELDRTNKDQILIRVDESALEGLGRTQNGPSKECFPSRDHTMEMTPEIDASGNAIISVGESEHNRLSSKKAKTTKTPPKMPSSSNLMDKPLKEPKKASRASVIACSKNAQKKQKVEVDKTTCTVSDDLKKSQSQLLMAKCKPYFSGETSTGSPSSDALKGNTKDDFSIHHERDGKSGMPVEGRLLEMDMSMKHLIAVAQAKRQQTHLQNLDHDNLGLVSGQVDMTVGSPTNYMLGLKRQELHSHKAVFSLLAHEFPSDKHPDIAEAEATSSSEHQSAEGLPSVNTEAAVAREAFEGMLETLSRTKESIGRATRLAIDCAKHGIANEIVEILVHKLESGSSFRRKVDLFFLVDSITQCSHSHRGIAGASYIPAVEAALARLVKAVAPSGASARENRRQCLKVLKLWIERKIFPESLLQRYVDDVGGLTDYSYAGLLIKRPSLSERSVDDPIRDMEGMLIDEYGSNVSFPLPGLITLQAFQEVEEEDLPTSYQRCGSSHVEPVSSAGESKNCLVPPNGRHHRALEVLDGELEMEDVSGHSEDADHFLDLLPRQDSSCRTLKVASVNFDQFDASLNGSPPLPQESPPPTPPLPLSPPPPSPPMPPSTSPPSPLPPLPSSPYPNHEPPSGPPPLFPSQLPFPSEPSAGGQQFHQHSASNECYTAPGGSQFVQMLIKAPVEVHVDAPQKPWFGSLRTSEYANHDAYFQSHASYSIQQYQPNNAPFVQHTFHPSLPPYSQSSNFSYQATGIQQQSFMPPHLSSNPPGIPQNYGSDDKWRTMNGDPSAQNQCGVWMPEVITASCSVQGYGISHAMPSRHDMLSHNGWKPP